MRFCDADADCNNIGMCVMKLAAEASVNATICSENCNLISNEGCKVAGTSCQVNLDGEANPRFFTHCDGSGNGQFGATCQTNLDCVPGTLCVITDGSTTPPTGKCGFYCDTSTNKCQAGTCNPLFVNNLPITVNGVSYGACL
jgi:hypothetical protein